MFYVMMVTDGIRSLRGSYSKESMAYAKLERLRASHKRGIFYVYTQTPEGWII